MHRQNSWQRSRRLICCGYAEQWAERQKADVMWVAKEEMANKGVQLGTEGKIHRPQ